MAARSKTEHAILEGTLRPDPKELSGKGLEAGKLKVGASTQQENSDLLYRLTHLWSARKEAESTPAEKAADKKTGTNDASAEEKIAVPKTSIDAACAALEVLKKASQVKS